MTAQTHLGGADRRRDADPAWVSDQASAGPRATPSRWAAVSGFTSDQAVTLACVATLLVHLLSLSQRLGPDEGGFTMVATHWREGGSFLYGPSWVDRPPGLIALFAVAHQLGPGGVRLTATALAVVLVAAIASAARAFGGSAAAGWAAWTAFAFSSSTLLEAQQLNGELAAATFVALSIAALAVAMRPSPPAGGRRLPWAVLAGASAATAVLMKQNFVDAFAFAGVLLAGSLATRANRQHQPAAAVLTTLAGFAAGTGLIALACVAWAHENGGVNALAYAMFGFRSDAASVMANWSWAAPRQRLGTLVQAAALSGLLLLVVQVAYSHGPGLRRLRPLTWAIAATIGVELLGVVAGENFWSHYLIALIPGVALAAGLGAGERFRGWRWTRRLIALSVAVTAAIAPISAIDAAQQPSRAWTTGRWVASAAQPGDTIVVPFTHANVIQASGLPPAYPYAWSLPVRTLDPDLSLLTSKLSGAGGPTWVVLWDDPHTWGLDSHDQVETALESHYRVVAEVCGHAVWLHDGVDRRLGATPAATACGGGAS